MQAWKMVTLAGVLVTVAGAGIAVAPRAQAQTAAVVVPAVEPLIAPRAQPVVAAQVERLVEPGDVHVDLGDFQEVFHLAGGARLGVTVREVNAEDVKKGGLDGLRGVVIEQVSEGSAAEKAGFKAGDIAVEFDGERVRSVQQFTRLVRETAPGRSVTALVMRDGQRSTLTVQPRDSWSEFSNLLRYEIPSRIITPKPPAPPRVPAPAPVPFLYSFRTGTTLGVTISDMPDQLAEYFGAKDGALVTSVVDDSPAAKAGVKAGDVITAINGQEVKVPGDVRRATQRLEGGAEFTMDVLRDKKKLALKGKTEARQTRGRRIVV
jgi:membrane-associated protease RseP (regulator of RpoE activity)